MKSWFWPSGGMNPNLEVAVYTCESQSRFLTRLLEYQCHP